MYSSVAEVKTEVSNATQYDNSIPSGHSIYFTSKAKVIINAQVGDNAKIVCEGNMVFVGTVGNNTKIKCKGAPIFIGSVGDNLEIQCDEQPTFLSETGKNHKILAKVNNSSMTGVKGNAVAMAGSNLVIKVGTFKQDDSKEQNSESSQRFQASSSERPKLR